MKRKGLFLFTLVWVCAVVLSGCGGESGSGTEDGKTTIKIFQYKVEIAEAFDRLIAEYEAEHPHINIEIETVGGGSDYSAALKTKFAGTEHPDIFNVAGYRELDTWIDSLEDLSNEPWVDDIIEVAKEPMTKDGKLYGQPLGLEGYGFIYNKDLFEQAGITELPKTLTELEAVAQQLQDAGIVPFSNGYQEWWVLGNHNANVPFAHQPDPVAFIDGLNAGTETIPGNAIFEDWVNLLDLTLAYGNKNPLTTDYNTQVTLFATGEAAMMQQGNWTQVQIDGINPDLNLGILPMPIGEDAEVYDKLFVGVPNNYVINKNSEVKEEAKDFLEWLVTSETGKRYMTEEFKFIPAFKSVTADGEVLGDLAAEIINYSDQDKLLSWNFNRFPEGVPQEYGAVMQAYIANPDPAKLLEDMQKSWDSLKE
ncbi:ABC transporter substrate-binding protein [Paenibacillus sp. FSL H7-0326]|uniref:ABC transporter substrate-binding protein n=1 Tax=Paenibacillus sp. FSL H7-0326 TaxID=1921144 RepID=UPI00096ECED7|nr:extracellular solute-binding protein [Paenibacillus sp. FSL H7-0326]OMC65484.1 ABC transporter substrate-binding protein [Paenibacillus sp. FSL H7-0326]